MSTRVRCNAGEGFRHRIAPILRPPFLIALILLVVGGPPFMVGRKNPHLLGKVLQYVIAGPPACAHSFTMPKLRHFDHLDTVRFVTFSCFRRHPYLLFAAACDSVVSELAKVRRQKTIRILGWVLMPDHVHLVVRPTGPGQLGRIVGQMKARAARSVISKVAPEQCCRRADGHIAIWERRCYDHNCRTIEDALEKIRYCHYNPVKAGLVECAEDWPWSSCRWYIGRTDLELEIDGLDLG